MHIKKIELWVFSLKKTTITCTVYINSTCSQLAKDRYMLVLLTIVTTKPAEICDLDGHVTILFDIYEL